jgi:hypothetical protein
MKKTIKEIAKELLQSEHNNGYGIKCYAVTEAMEKYNMEFKPLFDEIIKQGNLEGYIGNDYFSFQK